MKIIKLFFCCIFLYSCSNNKVYTPNANILIDLENSKYKVSDFVDMVESYKIIPLKSEDITNVANIVTDGNCYYVLDRLKSEVFKFDSTGNLLFTLNKLGRAANEYLSISDIMIEGDYLRIFDNKSSKIIDYSKYDGNYIKNKKLDEFYSNFISNSQIMVGYNSSGDSYFSSDMAMIYNSDDNSKKEIIKMPSFLKGISIRQYIPLSRYNDEILLTRLLSQNIYAITKDSVYMKYNIDFGKSNLTEKYLDKVSRDNAGQLISGLMKSDYVNSLDFFLETDAYIYFVFIYKGKMNVAYYNKMNKKTILLNKDFIDEFNSKWMMSPVLTKSENQDFVSAISALSFNDEVLPKLKEQNIPMVDSLVNCVGENRDLYEFFIMSYKLK